MTPCSKAASGRSGPATARSPPPPSQRRTTGPRYGQTVVVPARAVLVVDGVFLQREQLRELWTVAIYLKASPAECLERARRRDHAVRGSVAEVERRYRGRYLPGQVLYREDATPETAADVLIDNEDPASPVLIRYPSSASG